MNHLGRYAKQMAVLPSRRIKLLFYPAMNFHLWGGAKVEDPILNEALSCLSWWDPRSFREHMTHLFRKGYSPCTSQSLDMHSWCPFRPSWFRNIRRSMGLAFSACVFLRSINKKTFLCLGNHVPSQYITHSRHYTTVFLCPLCCLLSI